MGSIQKMGLGIKSLYRAFFANDSSRKWPCPGHNIEKEPHFLFIITPPYSGSTAFAQILNSSHSTAFLQKRGEGQWLIPGMCETDRWDPKKMINWESVRSVWLDRIENIQLLVQNVELIIEKSPPNLVRIDQLIKIFPNHSLVAFNRNPYANCSSILYRKHYPQNKSEKENIKIVSRLADKWLFRSRWIKKWIDEMQLTYITYEEFCAEPTTCVSKLAANLPALKTVDINKSIKVKGYKMQKIVNFNEVQISKLKQKEIDAISGVLTADIKLVSFFGYDILESSKII
jgi:hypothetical protein